MDLTQIAKNYKAASQELDFFVALSSKTGILINNEVFKNSPVSADIVKHVIAYYVSLGILMGYSHLLNYQRKMLKQIVKAKNAESELGKIKDILFDIGTQARVIVSALDTLSKTYRHKLSSKGEVQTLSDIWKVLDRSATDLEKTHIFTLQGDVKIMLENLGKNVEGGNENVRALQQLTSLVKGGDRTSEYHEVIIGGFDGGDGEAHISGFQSESEWQRKYIQHNLLTQDQAVARDNHYYQEVFLPKIAKITGSAESDEASITKQLHEVVDSPVDKYKEKLSKLQDLSQNLHSQYQAVLSQGIPQLLEYYMSRLKKPMQMEMIRQDDHLQITYKDDILEIDGTWSWQEDHPIKSVESLLELMETIFRAVHAADIKKVTGFAKEAFAQINNLKEDQVEAAYEELSNLLDSISAAKLNIRERHNSKENILMKMSTLRELLRREPTQLKMLEMPPKVKSLEGKTPEAKMKLLLKYTEYLLKKEASVLPDLKKDEEYYNLVAVHLGELMKQITHMFSPENTLTCIKKCSSAVIGVMRAEVLQKIIEKRYPSHSGLIPKLQAISNRLRAIMPGVTDEETYDGKLSLENIKKMASSYC